MPALLRRLPVPVFPCPGDNPLPGLTDTEKPRMRGPKRASKIRKLFNLEKADDVRKYVNTYRRKFTDKVRIVAVKLLHTSLSSCCSFLRRKTRVEDRLCVVKITLCAAGVSRPARRSPLSVTGGSVGAHVEPSVLSVTHRPARPTARHRRSSAWSPRSPCSASAGVRRSRR